jgi:membrane-bound lytic murein transglycosylase B
MPRFETFPERSLAQVCCFLLMILCFSAPAPLSAQTANDYFAGLRQRLAADGFPSETIDQLYGRPEVFLEADGVSRFFVHSEAKLNYDQFTTPESIQKARGYLENHIALLAETESNYGVDRHIITAILLVESRLGTIPGTRSCLNILSTLAALSDPAVQESFWSIIPSDRRISREQYDEKVRKRAEWGYRELKALLRYAERERIDPTAVTGSYAGAVGYAQFMPSNILAYGQDGDRDGGINLFNHADAVASIANYLKRHGWQPGISREKQEKAVHAYNPSSYYVNTILKIADLLKG